MPLSDEQEQVIGAYIQSMITSRQGLGDFLSTFELWHLLTDNERELLTKTGVVMQDYLDKEKLNNGKLG